MARSALAREFERSLKRELDFNVERRTIERCQAQFARDPTAHIPYVVKEYSTPRVIAMEFIGGVGVNDLDGLRRLGVDPAEVAVRGRADLAHARSSEFGFFHADPHPGNLRVLPGGVIAPLDYGMFGQLDGRTRERIADLLTGLLPRTPTASSAPSTPWRSAASTSTPGPCAATPPSWWPSYSDLTLDTIDLGTLAPRADRLHPDAPPAHPARPRPPDPLAGDDRGGRPRARPAFRHRRASFIRSSAT